MSFNTWNRHFGNLLLGSRSYLTGKQGILPDWQIKGKGLKEIYAPSQYLKAGEMIRKGITDRTTPLATGIFGIGAVEYAQGKEGWFPDWGRPGQFPKVIDPSGDGKGLINIDIPEFPKIPELPKIPEFPKIPNFPEIPDMSGAFDNFSLALATGLTKMGEGIGGGLGSVVPEMPSMSLVDEEGAPNVLVIGGLGLIAYMVLRGRK